jgi:hypothetical protein
MRKTLKIISVSKGWFFEKIDKIGNFLARLIRKRLGANH